MSRISWMFVIALATSSCQFDPAAPPERAALGEACASDAACVSGLCESSCVECRADAPCEGTAVCEGGRCVPPIAEVAPATLGGHVQTDPRGFKHRGRIEVPAVTTHRSTSGGR